MTSPNSNMLGLYYLPIPTICHEAVFNRQEVGVLLKTLSTTGFSYYDPDTEYIWVPEMASFQIEDELKSTDNRVKNIKEELLKLRKSGFYNEFLRRYSRPFHLSDLSPIEGPSIPLRSQDQEQDQEQEQEQELKPPSSPKGGTAVWQEQFSWIPEFLKTQRFVNLSPEELAYLLDPGFWERTHAACGGVVLAPLQVEFAKIGNWLVDNPSRRPTPKGFRRFVSSWLSKAYEKARRNGTYQQRNSGSPAKTGATAAGNPDREEAYSDERDRGKRWLAKHGKTVEGGVPKLPGLTE